MGPLKIEPCFHPECNERKRNREDGREHDDGAQVEFDRLHRRQGDAHACA